MEQTSHFARVLAFLEEKMGVLVTVAKMTVAALILNMGSSLSYLGI
ncbi:MAG: hypothetical protein V8S13_06875 [Gemmiger formicilis]